MKTQTLIGLDPVRDPVPAFPYACPSLDNRGAPHSGLLHLSLKIGGKRIRYAYIRKNGCSAFKLAAGFSPEVNITRMLLTCYPRPFRQHDATIFVWRDPEERVISLYRNKVIDRTNSEDFLRRLRRFAGSDDTSLETFLEFCASDSDPHCLPQSEHLGRTVYTHAIPLKRLHAAMLDLVGPAAAAPFARPVNASLPTPVHVSPRARQIIRAHYASDYRMIEHILAASP